MRFSGGTAATELLQAVEILRELNATSARKVPAHAPAGFVPTRWRGYLDEAATTGNSTAHRHYWELCTLLALRVGLRTGDVFVPGSCRYSDPAAFLLTPNKWGGAAGGVLPPGRQIRRCRSGVGPGRKRAAHGAGRAGSHPRGDGPARLDDDGELVISPLVAEGIPAEAVALKAELTEMLPFAPIVSLLARGLVPAGTVQGQAAQSSLLLGWLVGLFVLLAYRRTWGDFCALIATRCWLRWRSMVGRVPPNSAAIWATV